MNRSDKSKRYWGWENRRAERRSAEERRGMVRWEPDKSDRRRRRGRREFDQGTIWDNIRRT